MLGFEYSAQPTSDRGEYERRAPSLRRLLTYVASAYCSNCRTLCGVCCAIAITLVPALTRIWARERFEVSSAKSASRIADSDADRFSSVIDSWLEFVSNVL